MTHTDQIADLRKQYPREKPHGDEAEQEGAEQQGYPRY